MAALALGLTTGRPWPERPAEAVALSAVAVAAPLAGDFGAAVRRDLLDTVRVRQVPSPSREVADPPRADPLRVDGPSSPR